MLAASDTIVRSLHLIGAAVWTGGMVMLALAVGAARRTVSEPERIELFRALGRRFLFAGGIAMLVLIATGTDMAADRLGAWSDLTDTDYGERLLAKLGVVGRSSSASPCSTAWCRDRPSPGSAPRPWSARTTRSWTA